MKPAVLVTEATDFAQHIKRRGIFHALKAGLWRVGMAFHKGYLRFQDWSGLYSYPARFRFYEKNHLLDPINSPEICFSILIKASASKLEYLKDTCDALVNQSHRNWEAYLVMDRVKNEDDLTNYLHKDPRIKWIGYSSFLSWKDALKECKGDWVVYLNGGDTLAAEALTSIAHRIKENPSASLIYSDIDLLSPNGLIHFSPSFWPDWSPELLLSINYLRLAFLRRSELFKAAEKTAEFEDALLRCTETAQQVIHIPQVLCHLRDGQETGWLEDAFHPQAITAHLERLGLQEVTSQASPAFGCPQYFWSFKHPLISIIILTRDNVELLKRCIDSIIRYTPYPNYEIILVENNSREKSTFTYYEQLRSNPQVKVLPHNLPFNYSAFNNWGAQQSAGEVLLFLNNDIECFEAGWLEEMARWACRSEIGVVGAKLLYKSGQIQHAGLVIGLEGHANHVFAGKSEGYVGLFGSDEWYRDYSAVTGACMMMRRSVLDQIGGFDENYSLIFSDIELCLHAIQAGYRVVYTPFARLLHLEGATRASYKPSDDISRAYHLLEPLIEHGDPYYNPNLSTLLRVPTLRRPGEIPAKKRLDQILEYEG